MGSDVDHDPGGVIMRLSEGDVVCGVTAIMAREAVRGVEAAQSYSAGALARRLSIDSAASRSLLEALEAEGYLDKPYLGPLPEGHDGDSLPGEESGDQPLLLWHLSYPKGKGLAKARVGPPVPRPVAEGLVRDVLARVGEVNRDPAATHVITRVVLYGSMTDPGQLLVSDADLAVWADRRADAAFLARLRELGPQLGMDARRAEEAQAALDRSGWKRCWRLMTNASMSAWSTDGPTPHPPSRPAPPRSSCSPIPQRRRPAGPSRASRGEPGPTSSQQLRRPACQPGG
jgi:hypothetical protein